MLKAPGLRTLLSAVLFVLLVHVTPTPSWCSEPTAHTGSAPYILGVFPFIPAASVEGIFAPLAGEISRAIGRPVKLRTAPTFEKFMDDLRSRSFDIAFIQPFDYVDIAKPGGYLPVASRNDVLSSLIVVKQDSPVRTLKDLKGRKFGMPPKVSTVSFLNAVAVKKVGLRPQTDVSFVYTASHQACLQQLVIGNVDACGVSPAGVRLVEQQLKTTFRLVHETPTIPTPLFVIKKELPKKEQDLIANVIIGSDLAGVKPELRHMFIGDTVKPFKAASDKEYDVIRKYLKMMGSR